MGYSFYINNRGKTSTFLSMCFSSPLNGSVCRLFIISDTRFYDMIHYSCNYVNVHMCMYVGISTYMCIYISYFVRVVYIDWNFYNVT